VLSTPLNVHRTLIDVGGNIIFIQANLGYAWLRTTLSRFKFNRSADE